MTANMNTIKASGERISQETPVAIVVRAQDRQRNPARHSPSLSLKPKNCPILSDWALKSPTKTPKNKNPFSGNVRKHTSQKPKALKERISPGVMGSLPKIPPFHSQKPNQQTTGAPKFAPQTRTEL